MHSAGAPTRDQYIRHLYNYLTAKDHAILDDPRSSPSQRDSCVVSRLKGLGIVSASELGLIKWVMVMITEAEFRAYGTWSSYPEIYSRVQTIKSLLNSTKGYSGPFADKYPEFPSELDKSHFAIAYDPNDPPVHKYMQNFETIGNHIPLRKSSKYLQQESSQPQRNTQLGDVLQQLLTHSQSKSEPHLMQFVGKYAHYNPPHQPDWQPCAQSYARAVTYHEPSWWDTQSSWGQDKESYTSSGSFLICIYITRTRCPGDLSSRLSAI